MSNDKMNIRSIGICVLLILLYNLPNLLIIYFEDSIWVSSSIKKVYFLIFSSALTTLIICKGRNLLSKILKFVFSILLSIELASIIIFKTNIPLMAFDLIDNTNKLEIIEFIQSRGIQILITLTYLFILIYLSLKFNIESNIRQFIQRSSLIILALILIRSLIISNKDIDKDLSNNNKTSIYQKNIIERIASVSPWSLINTFYKHLNIKSQKKKLIESSREQTYLARLKKANSNKNIVLIIGESARKANQQLYGYNRKTNPYLSKIENLIVFNNYTAEANLTHNSISLILSSKSALYLNAAILEKGIMEVFNEVDFNTYWISNQFYYNEVNLKKLMSYADSVIKTYNYNDSAYDQNIIDQLPNLDRNKSNFLLINLKGSHFIYDRRYPEEFAKYKPDRTNSTFVNYNDKKNKEILVNSYDNSLLYTDFIINQIINFFSEREDETIIIYLSDHGENLYDNNSNNINHGLSKPTKYEVEVPLYIWYSDKFKVNHFDKILNLESNSNKVSSSESIFHTLVDLADIESNYFDSTQSLSNSKYKSKNRFVLDAHLKVYNTDSIINVTK